MLVDDEVNIEEKCSQAALTAAGLINYYVGLKLYSTVTSRTLIDCLFQLGICISYNRILPITKSFYEALCTIFGHYKIVLLTNLKKGCFTVSAKDNIDKNITANFVQPISIVLAYHYFSFLITRTKVKVLIVMALLMQFTTSRN